MLPRDSWEHRHRPIDANLDRLGASDREEYLPKIGRNASNIALRQLNKVGLILSKTKLRFLPCNL